MKNDYAMHCLTKYKRFHLIKSGANGTHPNPALIFSAGCEWESIYYDVHPFEEDAKKRERKLKDYGQSRIHIKRRFSKSLLNKYSASFTLGKLGNIKTYKEPKKEVYI